MAITTQQQALLAHWLINHKSYMDERRWDGGGGGPVPPPIPPNSVDLGQTLNLWSAEATFNNIDNLSVPNEFLYNSNSNGGLFEYWYFDVPASGSYVLDWTDRFQRGDVVELYENTGSGESMVETSVPNPVPGGNCQADDVSDPQTCFDSANWSSISARPLTNGLRYIWRLRQIVSSENSAFGCLPFSTGLSSLRVRSL